MYDLGTEWKMQNVCELYNNVCLMHGDFEYCKYPNFIIINQNTACRIYVLAADLTM